MAEREGAWPYKVIDQAEFAMPVGVDQHSGVYRMHYRGQEQIWPV